MDLNGKIAALLRDFAAIQPSKQKTWGYKRAAAAILALDRPVESLLRPDGTLQKIPNVGPSSARIIQEVLTTGTSATIEAAIGASPQKAEIDRGRALRGTFLSGAQVADALHNPALQGPERDGYRGDLQMHSTYSDGSQTLRDIVDAGIRLGYEYSAVTDHSYGLPIAGGVPMAKLAKQHDEIDRLNAEFRKRFRLLKGIEANIRADGSVDMTREELRTIEIVVASPHSGLRSKDDQTARMLRAVSAPGVHILGHPTGRKYGARAGIKAKWKRVFEAAARTGVAIEIDGDPSRQDIDSDLARQALNAGCLFALDSDAHSTKELQFIETAIAHARLAGIPQERVINYWPLARLLKWARLRSRDL